MKEILSAFEGKLNGMSIDELVEKLASEGITEEGDLAGLDKEILKDLGVPRAQANLMLKAFVKSEVSTVNIEKAKPAEPQNITVKMDTPVTADTVKELSERELLEKFNPARATSHYGSELDLRAHGKAFLVYDSNNKLVVDASAQLLAEIMDGDPARETYFLEGTPVAVYPVGQVPQSGFRDEHPLFHGEALRTDGTSVDNNVPFGGLSIEVRQLLYVAVEVGEINPRRSNEFEWDVFDLAQKGLETLQQRYPKAAVSLSKMATKPALKVERNRIGSRTKNQTATSPFFVQ